MRHRSNPSSTRASFLFLLAVFAPLTAMLGCGLIGKVNPGQDPVVVKTERTITESFDSVQFFLTYEDQHRTTIRSTYPQVHAFAEQTRTALKQKPNPFDAAWAAEDAYKQAKTDATAQSNLKTSLLVIEALARAAETALLQAQVHPTTASAEPGAH